MKFTSRITILSAFVTLAAPLVCTAQYQNSATGQTFNNSYSAMLSVTNSMTQNFTTMQRQYLGSLNSAAGAYSAAAGQPAAMQFPINATDFRGSISRLVPGRVASQLPNATPEQRQAVQALCDQIISNFERANRRNNLAIAMAYTVRLSLEIARGQRQSPAEAASTVTIFNNHLASLQSFRDMTAAEKQELYEESILTGGIAGVLYLEGRKQRNPGMQMQAKEMARAYLQRWVPTW